MNRLIILLLALSPLGALSQTNPAVPARLQQYNVEVFLRHPEEARVRVAEARVKLADRNLPATEAAVQRRRLEDFELILAMARTNTPAPYTLHEELQMRSAVTLGEQARTNANAVVAGLHEPGLHIKWSRENLPQLVAAGQLAQRALAAKDRSPTDQFLAFRQTLTAPAPGGKK
jgi:hypothetical protein